MDLILDISILFFLCGIGIGLFLIINPAFAIEIQRKFYAAINWKIEPISMEKEIRNTRIMGWILVIASIFILVLFLAG